MATRLRQRATTGALLVFSLSVFTGAMIVPVAAAEDNVAATQDFTLPPLEAPAPVSMGPVEGLSALVRHLAIGDPAATVEPGARSAEVALVQSRLEMLGFRPGPIDGVFGGQTVSAVLALQKHEGLERTGVLDPVTREALEALQAAGARDDLLGDRIEVDLVRQIIFLVQGDETTIINTSTGSGQPYIRANGATAISRTPRGDFAIGRRYDGTEVGYLGSLYRPMYFTGPYAIHGSGSVPEYPASHGCVRTSFGDMDHLWTVVPPAMQVYSYG